MHLYKIYFTNERSDTSDSHFQVFGNDQLVRPSTHLLYTYLVVFYLGTPVYTSMYSTKSVNSCMHAVLTNSQLSNFVLLIGDAGGRADAGQIPCPGLAGLGTRTINI